MGGPSLVLEVTEHVAIGDYPAVRCALARLRGTGVRLAADDAGAGYASMRHILNVAPEIIKLDWSLIASIDSEPVAQAVVAAVVEFAGITSSELVCERVETASEAKHADPVGCPLRPRVLLRPHRTGPVHRRGFPPARAVDLTHTSPARHARPGRTQARGAERVGVP